MRILTKTMIELGIKFARPSAEKILNTKGTTWGPRWVKGWVAVRDSAWRISFTFGARNDDWKPEWGGYKDFAKIAHAKLEVALREGMSTRLVVATQPWRLEEGEYLYPGGVTRGNICVAVSGANAATDEGIAEMVLSAIIMLAQQTTSERLRTGNNKI